MTRAWFAWAVSEEQPQHCTEKKRFGSQFTDVPYQRTARYTAGACALEVKQGIDMNDVGSKFSYAPSHKKNGRQEPDQEMKKRERIERPSRGDEGNFRDGIAGVTVGLGHRIPGTKYERRFELLRRQVRDQFEESMIGTASHI